MSEAATADLSSAQYELEIDINGSRERVWKALIEDTTLWWLPDFHMVGPDSTVEFDVSPGGRGLIEHGPDGSFLQWYSIQFYQPGQFTIYLVGNVAPDWGGPTTSNLKLSLLETDAGCTLQISDSHVGNVSEKYIESLATGWASLFGDGLGAHVEKN